VDGDRSNASLNGTIDDCAARGIHARPYLGDSSANPAAANPSAACLLRLYGDLLEGYVSSALCSFVRPIIASISHTATEAHMLPSDLRRLDSSLSLKQ